MKRIFDCLAALIALTLLLPLLLCVCLVLKLDSVGPLFYRGTRSGYKGRTFRLIKFRTMVQNAESVGGPSTGLYDPRITRVGAFLRRYKIDELPNLLNVLKGEMSLVGPRPEVPQYTAEYSEQERAILDVLPGITDLASIQFRHLDEWLGSENVDQTYETKVKPIKNKLRLYYATHASWELDMRILVATILAVVGGSTTHERALGLPLTNALRKFTE